MESEVMRIKFNELFRFVGPGVLEPKKVIEVNGITIGPGVIIKPTVSLGGARLQDYQPYDLAVEKIGDIYRIKGYYDDLDTNTSNQSTDESNGHHSAP